jgi:hypothetical protein
MKRRKKRRKKKRRKTKINLQLFTPSMRKKLS